MEINIIIQKLVVLVVLSGFVYPSNLQSSQQLRSSPRPMDTVEINKPAISTSSSKGYVTTFTREVIEEKNKIIIKIQFGEEIDDSLFKEKNIQVRESATLAERIAEWDTWNATKYMYSTFNFDHGRIQLDLGWKLLIFNVDGVRTVSRDSVIELYLYNQKKLFEQYYPNDSDLIRYGAEQCTFELKTYRDVDLSQVSVSFSKKDRCFTITIPYAQEKKK